MNYRITDLIEKKKHNIELTEDEINWMINMYTNGKIKDYQFSSMCMAIWFNGMTENETFWLTNAYINSGDTYNLKEIKEFKADKHSTGGVGDKTSLIFSPLVASYGIKVCKLSGRGLGQTGGTIDKLESFPNWKSELSNEQFLKAIKEVGIGLIAQSNNVVPADKKIYALRDVTATVDSLPLIAASIMSKKLIIESNGLILDVKVGDGAFMKDIDSATELANLMIKIGSKYNRKIAVIITDMNKPLGNAIGNAIEVKESLDTLNGKGPEDLNELVVTAVAIVLIQAKIFNDLKTAKEDVYKKLKSGEAAHFLKDFVVEQNGDWSVIEDYDKNFSCKNKIEIIAKDSGYITYTNSNTLGLLSMKLGAGRETKEDKIDHAAGIYLNKNFGEYVNKGDVIMTLFTNKEILDTWYSEAEKTFILSNEKPDNNPIIKIISNDIK